MQFSRILLAGAVAIVIALLGNLFISQILAKASDQLTTPFSIAITLLAILALTPLQLWLGWWSPKSKHAYFLTVVADEVNFAKDAQNDVQSYFAEKKIPPALDALVEIGAPDQLDWERLFQRTLEGLSQLKREHKQTHFVCTGFWLWDFALGTLLVDRHRFTLYHYLGGKLYPVWNGGNEIRQISNVSPYTAKIAQAKEQRPGTDSKSVVLIVAVGSANVLDAATAFANQKYPEFPLWHFESTFVDVDKPQLWRDLAVDLAYAICMLSEGGRRRVYLLGQAPAALSLMAGAGVGSVVRMQLVQYSRPDNQYREVLKLPLSER